MTIDKGILIRNVYYMLSYSFRNLQVGDYDNVAKEAFDDVYDLYAELLVRGVSVQLKQGLKRAYVECNEDLSIMRGKLNINGTLRNYAANRRSLDCSYDVLSVDNLFNQIIKTTFNVLLRTDSVKVKRKAQIRKLLPFLSDVSVTDVNLIKWDRLRFDRNCRNYQMLLYLCNFVLDRQLLTTDSGTYRMKTFSDAQMNLLFQNFVLEYYKRHHPETKAYARQIKWDIDVERSTMDILPIMQSDIMLRLGDRTLIIDTKYYSKTMQIYYDKKTIHSNNYYQIYAYVHHYDVAHSGKVDGMLLYAKTDEDITPNGLVVEKDGNQIMFRTIDLCCDFGEIKSQLDCLIECF